MKTNILILTSLFIAITGTSYSQDKQARKYAATISASDLKSRLSVLASDSLEGRETGSRGQKVAAQYIAEFFSEIGLEAVVEEKGEPSFFQKLDLYQGTINQVYFRRGEERKENLSDFLYYSRTETLGEEVVKLIYLEDVMDTTMTVKGKYVVFSSKEKDWKTMVEELEFREPAGYIILNEDEKQFAFMIKRFGAYFEKPAIRGEFDNQGEKILMVNRETLDWLFDGKSLKQGVEAQVVFNADMLIEPIATENVLGFLKGTEKPDEVIVITSHYDHLGKSGDEIYNGADDDGSGTTTVMEIAEAFAKAARKGKGPKRSLLFMCVTGEEKGLLGSEYYTDNPVFPLANTVTNLNIDMVGRVDPKYEELDNPNYIYLIGSDKLSQELHELSERVNANTEKLVFDYTYNDENDPNRFYYRSDHYNFAKNNIPIIFYFNGTHADYHKPTDTIEKIEFEKMEKIARLIYYTAWEIANQEKRITADNVTEN